MSGVIGKGSYQCTWNGDWHPESYNDYALLAAKLAPTATKLDVSSAARWDEDWDVIKSKCPSIEIVTEESSAVQAICTGHSDASIEVFSLSGQRVTNMNAKGIYIINGKKTVVR